jgi:NAD(P)-dependent dehydrogenase (short-subunit alcohol dehydrogenase family)
MVKLSSSRALNVRPGSASYLTSKLAVQRWIEALQVEYAEQGLLAYCVKPGANKTQITRVVSETGRNALPDRPDVAGDTIAWLAAERKEWLGGRYINHPWDMEELVQKREEIVSGHKLKLKLVFRDK